MRSQYVAKLWYNARSKNPTKDLDPLKYGWKIESEHLVPVWFDGASYPDLSKSQLEDEEVSEVPIEISDVAATSDSSDDESEDLYSSDSDTY